MATFDDLRAAFAAAAAAADATVAVGGGSGVVTAPGQVLTNAHNLGGAGDGVAVQFAAEPADGRVAGVDGDADLAVVAVDTGDVAPLAWADRPLATGDPVLAVANPRARGVRVTFGLVSATGQAFRGPGGRLVRDAVEHTAPLARGSSGGPLVDGAGGLVGVNTHRRGEGFYLALPATPALRRRVDALARGEIVARPTLGIAVAPSGVARRMRAAVGLDARDGLLVREVDPDGVAAASGIRPGDLIVAVDGQPLVSGDDLLERLDRLGPQASIRLDLVRGSDAAQVEVSFGAAGDDRRD